MKNIDKLFSLFVSFSLVPVIILLLVNGIAWATKVIFYVEKVLIFASISYYLISKSFSKPFILVVVDWAGS